MALEGLRAPSTAVKLSGPNKKVPTPEFEKIYTGMRRAVAAVYPNDSGSWNFTTELRGEDRTPLPPDTAAEWLEKLSKAPAFVQQLGRRYVTLWRDLETRGFQANGRELFEHQKALFAWLTIGGLCAGTRGKLPAILIRSPYGTGKSLVGGLAMEGFQDLLLEQMLKDGIERAKLPHGLIVGLRKELLIQNGLGHEQYLALRPPYKLDASHGREYYVQLERLFGKKFTSLFSRPQGRTNDWFDLFACGETEDDEEGFEKVAAGRRISDYLITHQKFELLQAMKEEGDAIFSLLQRIISGESVLLPDPRHVPRERPAPVRSGELKEGRFGGDMAYALQQQLGIKTTHKHLLPDPSTYSTWTDPENPALFGIMTAGSVSRRFEMLREDIRAELLPLVRLMIIDEAGKIAPVALTANIKEASGGEPLLIGLTARDGGAEGWDARSPDMPGHMPIELELTKPISFSIVGGEQQFPEGSEGAWEQYEEALFRPVPIATNLELPQPYETNGLVIVPPSLVHQYGIRLEEAYAKRGIPVEIHCYDSRSGIDRWKIIENALGAGNVTGNTPRPPRKVVGTSQLLSTGLSLPIIDGIDLLTNLREYELRQLLGRLYHRRTDGRRGSRTYFRQQIFVDTPDALLRKILDEMGIRFPQTNGRWPQFQNAIGPKAKKADDKLGEKLGAPEAVPDAVYKKRVQATSALKASPEWQPMPTWISSKSPKIDDQCFDVTGKIRAEYLRAFATMRKIGPFWDELEEAMLAAYEDGVQDDKLLDVVWTISDLILERIRLINVASTLRGRTYSKLN